MTKLGQAVVTAFVLTLALTLQPIAGWAADDQRGSEQSVENMVESLDADIKAWKLLAKRIKNAENTERQALLFRQDDRSFELLGDADTLAAAVVKLPADNPVRQQMEKRLVADLRDTGEGVYKRLREIEHSIVENKAELDTLSAASRIAAEAYIRALESIRFGYFAALVNHTDSRKLLGLPYEELRERLRQILFLHAEALAGRLEFTNSALKEVQTLLAQDQGNADIASAQTNLSNKQSEVLTELSNAANLLDKLDMDTSDYKTLLVKYSSGVSLSMVGLDVMRNLLEEWTQAVRESVVKNSPDIAMRLLIFVAVIVLFRWLSRITRRVVRASCDRSSLDLSSLLKDILVSASGGTVMILGIMMALAQVGISLGPMLAGLGVAGFVIGFALQDTLGNFAAGAMILIYRPYDVDDFVEVTGASGLVKKMNLVSTTITTFDNQTLVIPNSKIWGDVIKNVTAQNLRRVDLEFGIGYGDDIEKTERVLAEILQSHELVLASPEPLIKLHTLGDSSVNFIVRPWTKTQDYWTVYWDLMREVKMRFDREGISIPFPQRDIHIYQDGSS